MELKQDYSKYTSEDQTVWQILYKRQIGNLPDAATLAFLEGIKKINFTESSIPLFTDVNFLLEKLTGWHIKEVPGIVADDYFFQLLSKKQFPATTWLRTMNQLDYLEEPDMFHDVFAHIPLLTNQAFVDFLEALSHIALKHINNPNAIELISRIYWFTVEFGLILENGKLRIYGAGILSSAGETKFCLSDKPIIRNFDVLEILKEPFAKDKFQDKYFVISSYKQLFDSIDEIELQLKNELYRIKEENIVSL